MPRASDQARDLVSKLVTYESGQRLSAAEVWALKALEVSRNINFHRRLSTHTLKKKTRPRYEVRRHSAVCAFSAR